MVDSKCPEVSNLQLQVSPTVGRNLVEEWTRRGSGQVRWTRGITLGRRELQIPLSRLLIESSVQGGQDVCRWVTVPTLYSSQDVP